MNEKTSAGLRLPVQAAVDRTATGATLADGSGVEAQGWWDIAKTIGGALGL